MSEIIDKFYTPLLTGHGFIRDPDNQQYGDLGICWKLSPEVGEGTYWTYGQKDLYDIKIHNFSFHEDFMLEFSLPECLSITRYDSISGEELSPYRRLSAGCIKTFIGGYTPYKALIHKNIPIRSIGIEIAPAYYEDYLKKLYPEAQINPVDAFRKIDQTSDFPEMSRLLTEIKDYRGEGIAAKLFYEGKVAEAVSMIVEYQKKHPEKTAHKLSQQDIASVQTVASYLSDHYASDIPLERLTQIACMGTTKLKTCFKKYYDCTITEYIQQRRMSQAEYLLAYTAAGEAEIARIGVVKELQRQGVAKVLLAELEKECAEQGIDRILLDVRVSNKAARALYEAAGFKEDGIRQKFYENPEEDAILMSRPIEKKSENPEGVTL